MSLEDLGEPLTGVYSVPGGQARLFERGLTVQGAGGDAVVWFAFPMIGRPSILTGGHPETPPFEPDAIRFRLGGWRLEQLTPLIQNALAGRLSLVPIRRADLRVPLTVGSAEVVVAPEVYGISVTTPVLEERRLYDVAALADGGLWRVVAPHAVYRRQAWTDFGIAHITDMHVARRIDRFREVLVRAGRAEAAQRMINWNDRFRGFVKYANFLHGLGELDVILATGDLYDFIFEDDDDPAGGGNAAFLRQLLLGQTPGPEFPDVEELLVPIFLVPGNHDYRKHPYKLVFDIKVVKDLKRVKNFAGYHLLQSDAQLLGNGLDGRPGSEVENVGIAGATRMVEVDAAITAYKSFLADRGSYVVRLGVHRVAMLDSSHDVGMVTDLESALKLLLGREDEVTFVGGSPNCEGVSADDLQMVAAALEEIPAGGLFLVGLHAPLFNPWNDEYPYFLRETQRPAQPGQAHGFLARQDKGPVPGPNIEEEVEKRHPLWFAGPRDHRRVPFVKRGSTRDLLDFGVSRGQAEELMGLLAGVGARRPADVVLAGHTHFHNEFMVRTLPTGELAYFMDFYTQNPATCYPTRFTREWRAIPESHSAVPVTDVTNVEVVPGVAPDAPPWPLPFEAFIKNQVQVPPYPDPLSTATDPRAWWAAHRPLVLQTGALGPLQVLHEFAGFRVLSIKGDVIRRVHFVSTQRLEANQFRLPWGEAIRPDPVRRHLYVERSRPHQPPPAVGAPCAIVFPALGSTNVVYRDGDGRLHELWRKGAASGTSNLTKLADNAMPSDGDPTTYIDTTQGLQVALYRGKDGHVHSLYWSTGAVGHDALSATARAPKAAGNPVGFVQKDGTNVVVYRLQNGHLQSLWWTGTNAPGTEDLSGPAGAPTALGDPAPYINTVTGENIVIYRGTDRHVHSLYWTTGAVRHENLSGVAGSPEAAGDPVAYYTARGDVHQVTYRGEDRHVHELWWDAINPVRHLDLTAAAGAPPADGDPAAFYGAGTNTKHVLYRSADGHLNEISWVPFGSNPVHVDLMIESLAPLAESDPAAFTVEGPNTRHVVYRGRDGQIHEIRWTSADGALQSEWRWCNRCQGLFFGPGIGGSRCPAGGAHAAPAESGSANYSLAYDAAWDTRRQSEWRWCNKCQGLFYGPAAGTSRCPAGGAHAAPAESRSASYSLRLDAPAEPGRQLEWRWCNKCQGLFYGPAFGDSRCPAGAAHASPAQSGSANYGLLTD
jgi:hypothetical protein